MEKSRLTMVPRSDIIAFLSAMQTNLTHSKPACFGAYLRAVVSIVRMWESPRGDGDFSK